MIMFFFLLFLQLFILSFVLIVIVFIFKGISNVCIYLIDLGDR